MISTTRREALMGAVAVPALAGLPTWKASAATVVVHDPALEAGRRFADAGRAQGKDVLAIEGDRIRFARALFERSPAMVMGVSRPADALLIEDVAREVGYRPVSSSSVEDMIDASQSLDRGLVLGWVLARR